MLEGIETLASTAIPQYLLPTVGIIIVGSLLLKFQRTLLDTSLQRNTQLEIRLGEMEQRVSALVDEVHDCDVRNTRLIRVLLSHGIEVPSELIPKIDP